LIVKLVLWPDDRGAEAIGVVHISGDEVDFSSAQQRQDLYANVAAVEGQINMKGIEKFECVSGQTEVAVGVADYAELHCAVPG